MKNLLFSSYTLKDVEVSALEMVKLNGFCDLLVHVFSFYRKVSLVSGEMKVGDLIGTR